jgi:uncharacterized protein with HEPN domain
VSPRSEQERVGDILTAIATIADHRRRAAHAGIDEGTPLVLDAVVRQLAIIGEAATHLSDEVFARHPQIAWRGVKGMRLLLDHEYHRVDAGVVWETVEVELPRLEAALQVEVGRDSSAT